MRLTVNIDASPLRRWHLLLIERLRTIPNIDLSVSLPAIELVDQSGLGPLFRVEGVLHNLRSEGLFSRVSRVDVTIPTSSPNGGSDLVLDLGDGRAAASARRWLLHFDGGAGEGALVAALLTGRMPLVELKEGGELIAAGRPGTEYGRILLATLDDVLSRVVTLIVSAVSGGRLRVPALPPTEDEQAAAAPQAGIARTIVKAGISKALELVYRSCFHAPHWRVGWRRLDGPDLFALKRHPDGGWTDLPDDGTRFYADPFPILHEGRLTLFVEDFPHATGKGIISAVEFGPDGPLGTPEPVFEQPCHLSYPFVFARDGEVWMIPESCSAGRVDLFRATAFPGGWVKEATLIEGVTASDATLIELDGSWWLFATVRDGGGSFSDALHLWSAPDFRGPWRAHPRNPVLIDIASARPAGRMVLRDGQLLRPVQDCRLGYGKALGIARVTQLDDAGFAQDIETILEAGPLWPGRRLHSLNSAGGFEFIDGSAMVRRNPLARRKPAAAHASS
ncbi:MAG: formyl transferase [Hyphomicrobiales bacterium]|nr:MAG: formyl transferase [Hyphomicrobiales bacterium]